MMFVAAFISLLGENLNLFNLSSQLTIVIGLILGEISKSISNIHKGKLGGWVRQ